MIKQNNKSTQTTSRKFQLPDKKSLVQGGFIVLLIAITPYLFYIYESFPKNSKVWETSLFTIETSYANIQVFFWFLTGKIVPLYLLFLWFFTCKHWWHWIILVPIAMYCFQLWGLINQSRNLDVVEIYYLIPLMAILVPFIYLVRAKLFSKLRGSKEFEADLAKKQTLWQQIMDLFR